MQNASFYSENPTLPGVKNTQEIGYEFANTDDVVGKAMHIAFYLVSKCKKGGIQTREWATAETKRLMAPDHPKLDMSLVEMKILQRLHSYMNETSELLNQLKTLNPPLSSEQLKPFNDAMSSDRRVTLACLDALSKRAQKWPF